MVLGTIQLSELFFTSFYCFVVAVVVGTKSHFAYKQVSVQNHLHLFVNAVYRYNRIFPTDDIVISSEN